MIAISEKLSELENLTSILEAKLNSIPGLDDIRNITPKNNTIQSSNNAEEPSKLQIENNIPSNHQFNQQEETALVVANSQELTLPPNDDDGIPKISVREHSMYAPFIKLVKIGVPINLVKSKVVAAGLDPDLVDTPDKLIDAS